MSSFPSHSNSPVISGPRSSVRNAVDSKDGQCIDDGHVVMDMSSSSQSTSKRSNGDKDCKQMCKKLKSQLRRLLEENELKKEVFKRKQEQLYLMSRDVHYLLERLLPYHQNLLQDSGGSDSDADSSSTTTTTGNGKGKGRQSVENCNTLCSNAKTRTKHTVKVKIEPEEVLDTYYDNMLLEDKSIEGMDTDSSSFHHLSSLDSDDFKNIKPLHLSCSSSRQSNNLYSVGHKHKSRRTSLQTVSSMSKASPDYDKRNDSLYMFNDHELCNGSLNLISPNLLDRHAGLDLNLDSRDGLTSHDVQAALSMSFCLPNDISTNFSSMLPDETPATLPDDIFSET